MSLFIMKHTREDGSDLWSLANCPDRDSADKVAKVMDYSGDDAFCVYPFSFEMFNLLNLCLKERDAAQ